MEDWVTGSRAAAQPRGTLAWETGLLGSFKLVRPWTSHFTIPSLGCPIYNTGLLASGLRMAEKLQDWEPECPVCWNPFNNTFHTPKVLDCCHSFCVECLAHLSLVAPARRRLLCPLCRQPTVLASGQPVTDLPTDTAMLSLLRLEPHHVILEGHQLCLKDQPKSRYFLRQPRVYTLDVGPEPGSQTDTRQATAPASTPLPTPISSHYSLRDCFRNPEFRMFAYLMAVILSVTLLLIFSIFWTKQFFWGVG